MAKWDNETTIKFIQIYKQHPCLWNFRSADHKNKQKRDAAFVSIAQELNIADFGVQDVKNKIKNLRSTYSQEVKKIQESKKSGSGLASVYVSNIKWMKEMEEVFMNDLKRNIFENLPGKQSISQEAAADVHVNNPDAQVINANSHVNNPDSQVNNADAQVNTASNTATTSTPNATNTSTTSKTGKIPQATKRAKLVSNAISDLRALHQEISAESNSEEVTAFDMFGKYVAMQLKSMSFENALMAQSRFQNILTEYAIKDHREKTASRPSSSVANHGQNYAETMLAHSSLSNYSSQGTPETPETPETESNINYSNPSSVQSDSIASEPTFRPAAVSTMSPYADSYYQNPQSNMSLTQLRQSKPYNNPDNDIIRAAMNAAFENN